MRVLLTGCTGFIGSHFVRYFAEKHPDWELVVLDRMNYASALERISDYRDRVQIHFYDLRGEINDYISRQLGELDYIIHLGAETHVDKSLVDPRPFVETNVMGTFNLLEYARKQQPRLRMFFYISTDEVYGPAPSGIDHSEESLHQPSNPYAATKAAAEDLVFAWEHSMGVPTIVTNTMNNIGEYQHPEKFLPKIVRAILTGGVITIHGTPDNPGSRKYLYAADHASAIDFLIANGRRGEKYNVVGREEVTNFELVKRVERILGREAKYNFLDFHSTRPGHDARYSLDGAKMASMGWTPATGMDAALARTVQFYVDNPHWL